MSRVVRAPKWHAVAWLVAIAVVVVGVFSTVMLAHARELQFEDEQSHRVAEQRNDALAAYRKALDDLVTVTVSASAFVASSEQVTQAEWLAFYTALRGPGEIRDLEGLGLVVPVAWTDRQAFIDRIRRDYPEASLQIEGGEHDLALVEASTRGPGVIGHDLSADPLRRGALERARDEGVVAFTPPVHRISDVDLPEDQRPWIYVLYAPIYSTLETPPTVDARRAAFEGWVTSAVAAPNIAQLFATSGLDLAVFAGDRADPGRAIATNASVDAILADPRAMSSTVTRGGQTWTLTSVPSVGDDAGSGTSLVIATGLIVTFAVASVVIQLALQRDRLRSQVRRAVEDLEAANERLVQQALYDQLTRLPNRVLFEDRLDEALDRSRRSGDQLGVLFVDVDRFKAINDRYGHAVGDQVLRTIATRLAESLRASDTAARLGGDEFVVLCEGVGSLAQLERIAERTATAINGPCSLDGATIEIGASIGFTLADAGARPGELVDAADRAMYAVKADRRVSADVRHDEGRRPAPATANVG